MVSKTIRLEDLAALADTSIATVSRALNDHPNVNDATKRRIWALARENGYNFKPHMPSTLSGAQATISVVIPPAVSDGRSGINPFFMFLMTGLTAAARESHCDLMVTHSAPRTLQDLQDITSGLGAEGTIFLGQSAFHEEYNTLATQGRRFVVWGADMPGQLYCSVGSDNVRGGRRATNHLLRLGRKRIVFLGDTDELEVRRRFQGYREALGESDIGYNGDLVSTVHFEIESAQTTVERLMAHKVRFDAIFASSDMAAVGAIRALQRAGRSVPQDVSVVGYDNLPLGRYLSPALTTISQDLERAGRLMVSKLLSATDTRDVVSERLDTDLIVRDSCGS